MQKMKIGIVGAGISGLSIARLLSPHFDIEVLEKQPVIGGIARTSNVNGATYHLTGGHCFNSKHQDVLDFVFGQILPKSEWNFIERKAKVNLCGFEVQYPIEYATKEIFSHNALLAQQIIEDFFRKKDAMPVENMEDWFRKNFGNTLTDIYFKPYNEKIWKKGLSDITPDWIHEKMPVPSQSSFTKSLFIEQADGMPHQSFYYPKSNNQNTLIERLAKDLNIKLNFEVKAINFTSKGKWLINNNKEYDLVISTLPLNILPKLIYGCPQNVLEAASKLKYNKLTTLFCEAKPCEKTWTYIADPKRLAHRYIHIGNFFRPIKNYTIVEATGEHSYHDMLKDIEKDSFLIKPLDYHVSDHAYVVYDANYKKSVKEIKQYLSSINLHTLGRFGEWEYYNMDICIKKSIDLASVIHKNVADKKRL